MLKNTWLNFGGLTGGFQGGPLRNQDLPILVKKRPRIPDLADYSGVLKILSKITTPEIVYLARNSI